jgi:hypothetical protein
MAVVSVDQAQDHVLLRVAVCERLADHPFLRQRELGCGVTLVFVVQSTEKLAEPYTPAVPLLVLFDLLWRGQSRLSLVSCRSMLIERV